MPATHVDEFKAFLNQTELSLLEVIYKPGCIILNKLPFSAEIIFTSALAIMMLIAMRGYYVSHPYDVITLQVFGAIVLLTFIFVWLGFKPINRVTINYAGQTISVRSKNLIKLLFTGIKHYPFADVANLPVKTIPGGRRQLESNRVYLLLKSNDKRILLFDFVNEGQDIAIPNQLNSFIKSFR